MSRPSLGRLMMMNSTLLVTNASSVVVIDGRSIGKAQEEIKGVDLNVGESFGLSLGFGLGGLVEGIGSFIDRVFVKPVMQCGNMCAQSVCGK